MTPDRPDPNFPEIDPDDDDLEIIEEPPSEPTDYRPTPAEVAAEVHRTDPPLDILDRSEES